MNIIFFPKEETCRGINPLSVKNLCVRTILLIILYCRDCNLVSLVARKVSRKVFSQKFGVMLFHPTESNAFLKSIASKEAVVLVMS